MRRTLSLLVAITFISALAVFSHGCSRSGPDVDEKEETLDVDLNDSKIKERLGADDGYAFAIMYGADIHGSLETCG